MRAGTAHGAERQAVRPFNTCEPTARMSFFRSLNVPILLSSGPSMSNVASP